jgi:hypothetical protein
MIKREKKKKREKKVGEPTNNPIFNKANTKNVKKAR